jgi:hypothetical protein
VGCDVGASVGEGGSVFMGGEAMSGEADVGSSETFGVELRRQLLRMPQQ